MTDELISRLADEVRPVRRSALPRRLLVGLAIGAVIAFAVMVPWIGLRPDYPAAFADPMFWTKFAFTLVFSGFGWWAAERLSRPGGSIRLPVLGMVGLIAVTGMAGMGQIMMSPPEAVRDLMLGGTALVCPFYIVALSVPIYAAIVVVMRRLAPTNLTLAGFAAGLAAGAASSWVYAFHCGESGLPFITLWYTAGVLAAALLGAVLGRFVLRWR